MSSSKVASLTSALLFAKAGAASDAPGAPPDSGAKVQPLAARAEPGAPRGKDHTRLSLRLDALRHRRLRLAAAHLGQTDQSLVVAALDHYLDRVVATLLDGRCSCLEEGGKRRPNATAMAFASVKTDRTQ